MGYTKPMRTSGRINALFQVGLVKEAAALIWEEFTAAATLADKLAAWHPADRLSRFGSGGGGGHFLKKMEQLVEHVNTHFGAQLRHLPEKLHYTAENGAHFALQHHPIPGQPGRRRLAIQTILSKDMQPHAGSKPFTVDTLAHLAKLKVK